jgi:hypothetical protein
MTSAAEPSTSAAPSRTTVFDKFAIVALLLSSGAAAAHDFAGRSDWIGEHAYTNKNGSLCCGKNDCEPLSQEDVEPRKDGIWLPRYNELIPYKDATPSEDEFSYRCRNAAGWRTCFFFKYGAS